MTTHTGTIACGKAALSRVRPSPKELLKLTAAIAVAFVLMYAETWVIQEAPVWSSACALTPAATVQGDGPLRDTAGPIAVLH